MTGTQRGGWSRRDLLTLLLAAGLAVGILYLGWSFFWFLCDDAFIAFRYASNSQLGLGYVWNAPPFLPVEGYTSLLWLALLDGTWSLTGVEPPDSANALSLAFSYLSLVLVALIAWSMPLSPRFSATRIAWLSFVLLATVTNRTFLTWTTSGLETALFTCLILAWSYLSFCVRRGPVWMFGLASLAALLELTRPDGLLFLAVTMAALGLVSLRDRRKGLLTPGHFVALLPFAIPLAHLLWRHQTYGFWLPNTYYAKHVEAWPVAGLAYFSSFLLEYAFWLPLSIGLFWLQRRWRGLGAANRGLAAEPLDRRALLDRLTTWILMAGLIGQFAYYTFRIGGDHFEYRVYHHWVPLILLGFVYAMDGLGWTARRALSVFAIALLLSLPVPWLHKSLTYDRVTREQTEDMVVPVAPHLPALVRPYGRAFDTLQGWLIPRLVGNRHQTHKVFSEFQAGKYPTREEGLHFASGPLPVHEAWSVGIPGWTLPHVAIIDKFGLNDLVVARTQVLEGATRNMGHDRSAPRDYVMCFLPNVRFGGRGLTTHAREKPLTPERVKRCEQHFLQRTGS